MTIGARQLAIRQTRELNDANTVQGSERGERGIGGSVDEKGLNGQLIKEGSAEKKVKDQRGREKKGLTGEV